MDAYIHTSRIHACMHKCRYYMDAWMLVCMHASRGPPAHKHTYIPASPAACINVDTTWINGCMHKRMHTYLLLLQQRLVVYNPVWG